MTNAELLIELYEGGFVAESPVAVALNDNDRERQSVFSAPGLTVGDLILAIAPDGLHPHESQSPPIIRVGDEIGEVEGVNWGTENYEPSPLPNGTAVIFARRVEPLIRVAAEDFVRENHFDDLVAEPHFDGDDDGEVEVEVTVHDLSGHFAKLQAETSRIAEARRGSGIVLPEREPVDHFAELRADLGED